MLFLQIPNVIFGSTVASLGNELGVVFINAEDISTTQITPKEGNEKYEYVSIFIKNGRLYRIRVDKGQGEKYIIALLKAAKHKIAFHKETRDYGPKSDSDIWEGKE